MDPKLRKYHNRLRAKYPDKKFPSFSTKYSDDINEKRILVILQDPGNSGAEISKECCIENGDDTSENQKGVIINKLDLPLQHILFWNFYPHFDWSEISTDDYPNLNNYEIGLMRRNEKIMWAGELKFLTRILKNLRVIVVSGSPAWDGMRFFEPTSSIPLIYTPHPSDRGLAQDTENLYEKRWRIASQIAY